MTTPGPDSLRALVGEEFDSLTHRQHILAHADAWQLLIDAVNETDEPCSYECDGYAHAEGCPNIDRAAWMAKLQADNAALRERLEAALVLLGDGILVGEFSIDGAEWIANAAAFLASQPEVKP